MTYSPKTAFALVESLCSIVVEAGLVAKNRFRQNYKMDLKSDIDVLTSVDLECEKMILERIRCSYPTHSIWSEEAGVIEVEGAKSAWSWVLDPLDGTNNYVQGIPIFGVILALFYEDQPVGGILFDPIQNDLVFGASGAGVFHNDRRLNLLSHNLNLQRATIAWVQGYGVKGSRDAQLHMNSIDLSVKRVFTSWAPVFDSIRFLTGDFAALVSYDGEFTDFSAVRGLAPEVGAVVLPYSPDPKHERRLIIAPEPIATKLKEILEKGL